MNSNAYEMGRMVGSVIGSLLCIGLTFAAIAAVIAAFVKRTKGWIIAASIVSVVAFAGLAVGGAFAFREIRAAAQAKTARKPIVSEDGWVSLQIPGAWKSLPDLNRESMLKAGNVFAEEYLMVFSDPRTDFTGTLDEFATLTTDRMRGQLQNSSAAEAHPLTIDGLRAIRTLFEGTTGKVRISYLHTSIETPDGFHQIVQWTLPSKKAKAFPIFEEVAASFRVVKPRTDAAPPPKPL
ncbi:MAG: hypothetical protein ABMA13_17945 [Chthoniobacteraceae bacterium]